MSKYLEVRRKIIYKLYELINEIGYEVSMLHLFNLPEQSMSTQCRPRPPKRQQSAKYNPTRKWSGNGYWVLSEPTSTDTEWR